MSENGSEAGHETTDSLAAWRQGDFTWDYADFAFLSRSGDMVRESDVESPDDSGKTVGVAVISQTCDIERDSSEVPYVTVCPLVEMSDNAFKSVKKNRRPRMGFLPGLEEEKVAVDFSRTMSVEKELLRTWKRKIGCKSEEEQTQFARIIEICFGRFPFPDNLSKSLEKFRQRVFDKYDRRSPFGESLSYLREIRVMWESDEPDDLKVDVTFVGILRTERGERNSIHGMEEEVEKLKTKIENDISEEITKIAWRDPYRSGEPKIFLTTLDQISVADYRRSHPLDVNSLSYDQKLK